MRGSMEGGGCFPTGRHYPGIAHLLRIHVQGLAEEWTADSELSQIQWVSLDTETTGRDPLVDRVIEVGAVIFRGGVAVDRRGWLIQPDCPIPAEATEVHGITDADVADAPRFHEVLPEIAEFLRGSLPLAYNAEFDRKFLLEEIRRQGDLENRPAAFRPEVRWIDPLSWARELHKEEKSRALGDVCERLGIQLERAHRATDDAEAAGAVMAAFTRDVRVPGTYGAFIREQGRLERLFELERVRWRN